MDHSTLRRLSAALVLAGSVLAASLSSAEAPGTSWDEKYKDEPYVVLLVEEEIRINKDFSTVETGRMVARIQKEGGKSLGEIPISYDQSREEILEIEAFTIAPDGTKRGPEKIQDLNAAGDSGIYSDNRVKMITMPNVVVGSVIDWKVKGTSMRPVIPGHFTEAFHFSEPHPVKEARFRLIAPKEITLHIKNMNTDIIPAVERSGGEVIYTWTVRESDKVEIEDYMPSPEEVFKSVAVSTLGDWRQIAEWSGALFKKNLIVSPEIAQKVKELTAGKATTAEKIQAIITYIQDDFRYIAMSMDFHSYEPYPADKIFANKYGDCKDHTLLAMTMLSEIGVTAWPALISTRSELRRDDLLPMPSHFNHVILFFELEGQRHFTDVLLKGYRFSDMPLLHGGKRVFVVNGQGGFFATLPPASREELTNVYEESVLIKDDGTAVVETKVVFARGVSVGLREQLKSSSAGDREKFFAAVETSLASGGKVLARTWSNIETPFEQIAVTLKFEHASWVQRMGDLMMFGLPQIPRNSLFSSPKREHPLIFLSGSRDERRVSYTIPDGYEIISLPKRVARDPPFAGYTREYAAEGARITGSQLFGFKRGRVPAGEYPAVQGFLDEITRSTNEKILIKKKG